MLTPDERGRVPGAFADDLAARANPRDLLTVIFPVDYQPLLLALPTTITLPGDIAAFVLTTVIESKWSKNPALLDLLLSHLITLGGQFNTELDRVRRHEDPNPSVYDVAWMSGQRPFFDRGDFRKHLACLVDDNAQSILRITSQPDAWGRTYGTRIVQHLSNVLPGNMQVVSVELSPKTGPSYRPEDLAAAIASQLGMGLVSPARTNSGYPSAAAQWIAAALVQKPGRWVVVLEGFGQAITDEVRETIEALAALVLAGQYNARVRLVLIDYGRDLPGVSLADMLEEQLQSESSITATHVQACLTERNEQRRAPRRTSAGSGSAGPRGTGHARARAGGRTRPRREAQREPHQAVQCNRRANSSGGEQWRLRCSSTLKQVLAFLADESSAASPSVATPEQVQAYREAAAVLDAFADPELLRPVGAEPVPGAVAEILGRDLVLATGSRFSGKVMLNPEIRADVLRDLVSSGRVKGVLEANAAERSGSLQAHLEKYLLHEPPPLEKQSLDELNETRQISVWLEDVVPGVPTEDEVRRRAAYLRLLAPFETIAGDTVFRGRTKELDDLRTFIGVVAPQSVVRKVQQTLSVGLNRTASPRSASMGQVASASPLWWPGSCSNTRGCARTCGCPSRTSTSIASPSMSAIPSGSPRSWRASSLRSSQAMAASTSSLHPMDESSRVRLSPSRSASRWRDASWPISWRPCRTCSDRGHTSLCSTRSRSSSTAARHAPSRCGRCSAGFRSAGRFCAS
jgi:hypothetical protein